MSRAAGSGEEDLSSAPGRAPGDRRRAHVWPAVVMLAASTFALPPGAEARRLPTPICLPGDGPLLLQKLQANALETCVEVDSSDDLRCFATDLGKGQLRAIPVPAGLAPDASHPRIAEPPPAMKLELGENSVEVCRANGSACKTVRASAEVDPGLGLGAELNAAGTIVALAYLSGDTLVETFEVATGKRLMQLHGRSKKAMCISASFLGESLLIHERECGSDDVRASWLASADGKRLADAGGGKAFASPLRPAHLRGDEWAFPARRGEALAIQNVKTGKVLKRISLGARSTLASVIADDQRAVVAYQDKRLGDLAVIDLATYKVRKLAGARCPKR